MPSGYNFDDTLERLLAWATANPREFDARSARIAASLLDRWRGTWQADIGEDGYDVSLEQLQTLAADLTRPLTEDELRENLGRSDVVATMLGEDGQHHVGGPGEKWVAWTAFVALMYIRLARQRNLDFDAPFEGSDAEMVATYQMFGEADAELDQFDDYRELLAVAGA